MFSHERLVILDADGTTIDAFKAIEKTFAHHGMDIGPLERFQKRRNLFKYLGGVKEMPKNLRQQLGRRQRSQIIATLTHPFMVSYGFEDFDRLHLKHGIPKENIARSPDELDRRVVHALRIER